MGGIKKGTATAARTDDLLTIIQLQLAELPDGPKIIAGYLNVSIDSFETNQGQLQPKQGWTDVGMDARICKGMIGQHTCNASDKAKESHIDYILSNRWLTPALENGRGEICGNHTDKPFLEDIISPNSTRHRRSCNLALTTRTH